MLFKKIMARLFGIGNWVIVSLILSRETYGDVTILIIRDRDSDIIKRRKILGHIRDLSDASDIIGIPAIVPMQSGEKFLYDPDSMMFFDVLTGEPKDVNRAGGGGK